MLICSFYFCQYNQRKDDYSAKSTRQVDIDVINEVIVISVTLGLKKIGVSRLHRK